MIHLLKQLPVWSLDYAYDCCCYMQLVVSTALMSCQGLVTKVTVCVLSVRPDLPENV